MTSWRRRRGVWSVYWIQFVAIAADTVIRVRVSFLLFILHRSFFSFLLLLLLLRLYNLRGLLSFVRGSCETPATPASTSAPTDKEDQPPILNGYSRNVRIIRLSCLRIFSGRFPCSRLALFIEGPTPLSCHGRDLWPQGMKLSGQANNNNVNPLPSRQFAICCLWPKLLTTDWQNEFDLYLLFSLHHFSRSLLTFWTAHFSTYPPPWAAETITALLRSLGE